MNETTESSSAPAAVATEERAWADLQVRMNEATERLRRAAALYVAKAGPKELMALAAGLETDDEGMAQGEDAADESCDAQRHAPLRVNVQAESKKEYPKPPKGCYYPRSGDKQQGYCPAVWDAAVMVYPVGTVKVLERAGQWLTPEQWRLAVEMLEEGYVVGFSVREGEYVDLACRLAEKCHFPLQAVSDDNDGEQVYFARRVMEMPSE